MKSEKKNIAMDPKKMSGNWKETMQSIFHVQKIHLIQCVMKCMKIYRHKFVPPNISNPSFDPMDMEGNSLHLDPPCSFQGTNRWHPVNELKSGQKSVRTFFLIVIFSSLSLSLSLSLSDGGTGIKGVSNDSLPVENHRWSYSCNISWVNCSHPSRYQSWSFFPFL